MAKITRLDSEAIVTQLVSLERELGMPATEFYDRFRAGELGDSVRVMHWAGICYQALRHGILRP